MTFIIPVRNDAARLRRCLESIKASLGPIPCEIIVADNGSTDESADVARQAGVRLLSLPNRRVAEVRNDAAAAARGAWLAFVDSDNELDVGWSEAASLAIQDPTVSAIGANYRPPANGTWVQHTYDLLRDHQPGNRPTAWLPSGNLVVRRTAFEDIGGFDESLETCEDVDLCQRLARRGDQLLTLDRLRSTHYGDPATLSALFLGELWRGRDNLRVSLRAPLTLRSAIGITVTLATLAALVAIPVGAITWLLGGSTLVTAAGLWLLAATLARVTVMIGRAPAANRNAGLFVRAWLVVIVYDAARALALVARTGHGARRRA